MHVRHLGVFLAVFALLALVGGCAPDDPRLLLLQAREGYQIDLLNWAERMVPDEAEASAAAAEDETDPAGEPVSGDAEAAAEELESEGILSLRVTRATTNIELPCLTVDVIFGSDDETEIGRDTIELDLSDMSALGGTKEINLVVPLPEEPIAQVAVDLHRLDIDDPELKELCEAKAVPELSR